MTARRARRTVVQSPFSGGWARLGWIRATSLASPLRVRPSRTALGPRRGAGRPGAAPRLLDGRAGRGARRPDGARLRARRAPVHRGEGRAGAGGRARRGGCNPPGDRHRDHVNAYWDRGLLGIAVDADFADQPFRLPALRQRDERAQPERREDVAPHAHHGHERQPAENPDAPETILLGAGTQVPCPPPTDTLDCIPADGFSHSIGTVRADARRHAVARVGGRLGLLGSRSEGGAHLQRAQLRRQDHPRRSRRPRDWPAIRSALPRPTSPRFAPSSTRRAFATRSGSSCDPAAGPLVGDVGWNSREELDIAQPGRSYGWPCYEGTDPDAELPGSGELHRRVRRRAVGAQPPAYDYPHSGRTRRSWPARATRGRSTRPPIKARGSSATTRRA